MVTSWSQTGMGGWGGGGQAQGPGPRTSRWECVHHFLSQGGFPDLGAAEAAEEAPMSGGGLQTLKSAPCPHSQEGGPPVPQGSTSISGLTGSYLSARCLSTRTKSSWGLLRG